MNETKKCNCCNRVKTIDNFTVDSRTKDGHCVSCKSCVREYYLANKERIAEMKRQRDLAKIQNESTKRCPRCKEIKPVEDFKRGESTLAAYCSVCYKEYFLEHRDRMREVSLKYYYDNREEILQKQKEKYKAKVKVKKPSNRIILSDEEMEAKIKERRHRYYLKRRDADRLAEAQNNNG